MARQSKTPGEPSPSEAGPVWLRQSIAPKLRLVAKESRTFFEEELSKSGATFATWTTLATLKLEGPMIQRALAKFLSIEGPTLSRHLEAMERRGLVVRNREGSDRRAATVALTPEGERMCTAIETVALKSQEQMLAGLSADDIELLGTLLDRVLANVTSR
ncbi:MarR family winged helix-turn-helix transcriptional regulator [Streptomyces sp. NBC_00448]|uniref:MarR family winged helix-turn-helix transcriptional regulator n=1 Tax=Streptomyces sp. NBC_00448 TaxID=2903652 RepID=UPI002E1AECAF